ncbi:uncharacterized protein [Nerophis lumbriciformis]|uniref:uncharacterized protein isoform X1 n=1 Tax=Nerophis lumbriciformis TaxID=546530 RepID=UPI003BAA0B94
MSQVRSFLEFAGTRTGARDPVYCGLAVFDALFLFPFKKKASSIAWIFACNCSCYVRLINANMNRKTVPVSLSTLRRRTRVDVQKRLHQIQTDITGIGADDRVLSENTAQSSSAAHAMPEVHVFTEEDMELEADLDDVYWDESDGDGTSGSDSENDDPTSLSDNIANWAVSFGISMVALTALLSILHLTHPNLPKDGRTLLKTKVQYSIQEQAGGNYHHLASFPP